MSFIIQNNTDGSVNFLNSGNTALTINANNSINVGAFTGGITADTGIINIGSGQLYKDASGNMGLGVTPSAWNTNYRAIQIGSGGGISGRTDSALEMQLLGNAFRNTSGGYTYATTNKASRFMIDGDGSFGWYQAPSGTAGNPVTFTQAMTLNSGWGALLIGGTTDPSSNNIRLSIAGRSGGNNGGLELLTDGGGGGAIFSNNGAGLQFWSFTGAAGSESYTERARIDSSGNLMFNSGYGSVAKAYGCRAWVNFSGTGTVAIRASGNVSSITDNNTGDYTVNFTTAMVDNYYSVVDGSGSSAPTYTTPLRIEPFYTTSFLVRAYQDMSPSSLVDCPNIYLAIFR